MNLESPFLRHVFRLVAAALLMTAAACTSKDKEPKPKKPKKPRDPVEQKVFYDGWWPEHWKR